MRRTKQVQEMVNTANNYLRVNHIKDEKNEFVCVFQSCLLHAGTYQGYNAYTADGKLSGFNGTTTDYIQFY